MLKIVAAAFLAAAVQQSNQQGQVPAETSVPTASSEPSDIVVEAQRPLKRDAIDKFVGQITRRSENQIARLHDPVCPLVMGLSTEGAALVVKRIKDIARQLNIRVDRGKKCDANIILVLTPNGANFVNEVRIKHNSWLFGLDTVDINRLARPGLPARAWSSTSLRNEVGESPSKGILYVRSASYLTEPTKQYVDASFVVIDVEAAKELNLQQIADYTAMRALGNTREPPSAAGVRSILTLFDQTLAVRPQGLSNLDMAYLRALYARAGEELAIRERVRIAKQIAKTQ